MFNIERAFEASGITLHQTGYLADENFFYRVVRDEVQVGIRLNFDRWANSIDYVFSVPRTVKSYDSIMSQLKNITIKKSAKRGEEIRLNP